MKKSTKVYIEISNKGEIDTNGLHLMGVSDKRGQDWYAYFDVPIKWWEFWLMFK